MDPIGYWYRRWFELEAWLKAWFVSSKITDADRKIYYFIIERPLISTERLVWNWTHFKYVRSKTMVLRLLWKLETHRAIRFDHGWIRYY